MANKNEAWGIDVGANAIKAVKLVRAGADVRVEEFEVLPFKQVLTTPDLDVDQTIQVGLDQIMQKYEMDKARVVVSVPGNMAFARFAKLPPVEPKKIPDIVKFEAQQQIPFPIEQVEWDYQVFQQDDSPDVEVGIFAITKERVMQYLSNYRAVDMKVDSLTLSPLAVYNTFNYDQEGGGGAIYMDIGTVSTDVIIVEDGGIWLRTLPIGGNNFTEALVKQFKISFPKAEKLKREAATSKYAKQIFQAMRAVFADLVQEVQRSLGFYQSLNRDSNLTKLVGVGSTFRLPGLQKFLKQQLQIDVVRPDAFERISVIDGKRESEFSNHALNMATALGLGLQGLGLEKVSANILPSHVLASRMWRAKQPWIAASAACFVIAAGLVAARHFADASLIDEDLSSYQRDIRPVLSDAQAKSSQWSEIQQNSDPRQFISNIRRMIDYRNVWPLLMQDLNAAMLAIEPQPELLDNQYAQQKQIDRSQRRRVYLESVTSRYEPLLANGEPPPASLAQLAEESFTIEQFFGEPDDRSGQDDGELPDANGPRFIITLTGTTPLASADTELNARLIQWFRDNAVREDRPYSFTFEDGKNPIIELGRVGSSGSDRGSRSRFGGGSATFNPGAAMSPDMEFADRGFGQRPGSRGSGGGAVNIDDLLPERPLAEEERSRDWRFQIELLVTLKSPQEARPRTDATPSRPTPADDDAPADSPTADTPNTPPLAQAPTATEVNR
jgi:type IV pilus assembly protein PilM